MNIKHKIRKTKSFLLKKVILISYSIVKNNIELLRGTGRTTDTIYEIIKYMILNPNNKIYLVCDNLNNYKIMVRKIQDIVYENALTGIGNVYLRITYKNINDCDIVGDKVIITNERGLVHNKYMVFIDHYAIEYKYFINFKNNTPNLIEYYIDKWIKK